MATVGEKVTDTIVNALGKGLESAGLGQNADLKAIIGPRVRECLSQMPPGSPEYRELERLVSDTSIVDVILKLAGSIMGVIQSLWTMGSPTAELLGQASWQVTPSKIPPANAVIAGAWRGAVSFDDAKVLLRRLGYTQLNQDVLQAALRQPLRADDILELRRRGYIDGAKMTRLLDGAGFDAEARAGLLQLQWRIPGVPDLVRMAVREAFTPEIAERFGQYQDFPGAVAEYAAMQGLDEEWAKRYWAAHWDLPSTTQGFEMLHRGVISEADMSLLLRAQDVMPFWRDKLTAIAYNPLTRVDVRRMYHLGVLTEEEVLQAYRNLGYNAENAANLLEFTKVYYGPEDEDPEEQDRELTKAEILDGYRKRILTADQARTALLEMGYPAAKAEFYLSREDLKAEQALKDAYISRWRSLFINGIASADEVSSNLASLGIGQAEINELLPLWYLDKIQAESKPSRTDINRFLQKGIITQSQWTQQMQLLGYADQYIDWYLQDLQVPG